MDANKYCLPIRNICFCFIFPNFLSRKACTSWVVYQHVMVCWLTTLKPWPPSWVGDCKPLALWCILCYFLFKSYLVCKHPWPFLPIQFLSVAFKQLVIYCATFQVLYYKDNWFQQYNLFLATMIVSLTSHCFRL